MDSVLKQKHARISFLWVFWGGFYSSCVRFLDLCDSVILKSVPTVAQVMIHDEASRYPVIIDKTVVSLP